VHLYIHTHTHTNTYTQTSSIAVFDPERLSPCAMYSFVLCRRVLYEQYERIFHVQRKMYQKIAKNAI